MDQARAVKRGANSESVPGTIRIILDAINRDAVLSGNTGKRRRHPDGHVILLEEKHSVGTQRAICQPDCFGICADLFGYGFKQRRLTRFRRAAVNSEFHACIEICRHVNKTRAA